MDSNSNCLILNNESIDVNNDINITERMQTAKRHMQMLGDYYNSKIYINLDIVSIIYI